MRTVPDQPQPPLVPEVRERLEALGAHLRGWRLTVDLDDGGGGLTVTVPGGDGPPVQSIVTCRRRPSDNDRYWYRDGTVPIAEAVPERIPDAGARIVADLRRRQQS